MKFREICGVKANLRNLNNINIILGRNGSGKSLFLRDIGSSIAKDNDIFNVRYISPERGGSFTIDGSVQANMKMDPDFLRRSRDVNQAQNFRAASAALLRDAELIYLRRLAHTPELRGDFEKTFQRDRVDKINALLQNIKLTVTDTDFGFHSLLNDDYPPHAMISSGESEVISLASEIIYFFETINHNKFNVLLLDEPDVHLHPDLQARLGKFIIAMLDEFSYHREIISICIATHSTSFVCSIATSSYVSVGTKNFQVDNVNLKPASVELQKIAPFFGHPLSLSLSNDAPLILEGEDDERVWQYAARYSQGRIKIFPILAVSVNVQGDLECMCAEILKSVYDDPIGFSVRDGDGVVKEPLTHKIPLRRYRLNCYAIENLLVTDQCLSVIGISWFDFQSKIQDWLDGNATHKDNALVGNLLNSPDRLQHTKIKEIKNLIGAIAGCTKPWEYIVGRAIGALNQQDLAESNMLARYIGIDALKAVIFREFE